MILATEMVLIVLILLVLLIVMLLVLLMVLFMMFLGLFAMKMIRKICWTQLPPSKMWMLTCST